MAEDQTSGAGVAAALSQQEQEIDAAMASLGANRAKVAAHLGISLQQLKSRIAQSEVLSKKFHGKNLNLKKLQEQALAQAGIRDDATPLQEAVVESRARVETLAVVQQSRREWALASEIGSDQVSKSLAYITRHKKDRWVIVEGHTLRTLDAIMNLQERLQERASQLLARDVKGELEVVEQKAVISNIAELAAIQTRMMANLEKNAILRSAIESKKGGGPKGKAGFSPLQVIVNNNGKTAGTTVVEPREEGENGHEHGPTNGERGPILDAETVQT